jgi:hypothetical protein
MYSALPITVRLRCLNLGINGEAADIEKKHRELGILA